ncbi:hypothetical protein AY555_01280 [Haematospirillum jordaniae]|uniref:Uncharacterized protein n=1 Tax=Haematospirillum jordaniae TaxID=1549855 RepID=A0A143DBB6_9PROT|nr:hypothetical protein AY555_01280 [Haematospirillum jordaniae]
MNALANAVRNKEPPWPWAYRQHRVRSLAPHCIELTRDKTRCIYFSVCLQLAERSCTRYPLALAPTFFPEGDGSLFVRMIMQKRSAIRWHTLYVPKETITPAAL